MPSSAIHTDQAPEAIGPYSQAVRNGSMLFISGQLPLVPGTGKLVEGSIADQTRQVVNNIAAIIKAAGGNLDNIVKTTIFLTDLNDFAEVNEAYGSFFESVPPARATVQVAALPLGAPVEIEALAILKS